MFQDNHRLQDEQVGSISWDDQHDPTVSGLGILFFFSSSHWVARNPRLSQGDWDRLFILVFHDMTLLYEHSPSPRVIIIFHLGQLIYPNEIMMTISLVRIKWVHHFGFILFCITIMMLIPIIANIPIYIYICHWYDQNYRIIINTHYSHNMII